MAQIYSKEVGFISSLAPATKRQFRRGKEEELVCKHLQPWCLDLKGSAEFSLAPKWTTGPEKGTPGGY